MLQRFISLVTATLALVVAPVAVHAQADERPPADRYTIAGSFGGVSRPDRLNPSGAPDWQRGWAGSIDAAYWFSRHVGVRVGTTLAQDRARSAPVDGQTFNKLAYDADVVVRTFRRAGQGAVIPYVVGGAGGLTIHPIGSGSSWTTAAGNLGAGVEYRLGRWGVRAEARDFLYRFNRYGYDHTQNQVALQGGVTLSF